MENLIFNFGAYNKLANFRWNNFIWLCKFHSKMCTCDPKFPSFDGKSISIKNVFHWNALVINENKNNGNCFTKASEREKKRERSHCFCRIENEMKFSSVYDIPAGKLMHFIVESNRIINFPLDSILSFGQRICKRRTRSIKWNPMISFYSRKTWDLSISLSLCRSSASHSVLLPYSNGFCWSNPKNRCVQITLLFSLGRMNNWYYNQVKLCSIKVWTLYDIIKRRPNIEI